MYLMLSTVVCLMSIPCIYYALCRALYIYHMLSVVFSVYTLYCAMHSVA